MSITLRAKEDPKCKFTSLAHLLTEDFLNDFFTKNRVKTALRVGLKAKQYKP